MNAATVWVKTTLTKLDAVRDIAKGLPEVAKLLTGMASQPAVVEIAPKLQSQALIVQSAAELLLQRLNDVLAGN